MTGSGELKTELSSLIDEFTRIRALRSRAAVAAAIGADPKRLSDWISGAHVPQTFDALWKVVVPLLAEVHGRPGPRTRHPQQLLWWSERRGHWHTVYERAGGRAPRRNGLPPDGPTPNTVPEGHRENERPYEITPLTVSSAQGSMPPSRLLSADSAVVRFTGRSSEQAALEAWRDNPGPEWRVRLTHGAGGLGKTRLALRFAATAREKGWRTLAVRPRRSLPLAPSPERPVPPSGIVGSGSSGRSVGQSYGASPDRSSGTLVVVDYADRLPMADLLQALADVLVPGEVRVLLLARSTGGWWSRVTDDLDASLIPHEAVELGPLADDLPARLAHFHAAVDDFSATLRRVTPRLSAPDLRGARYQQVLALHTVALAAVLDGTRGTLDEATAALMRRERAHWHAATPPGTAAADLERVVFIATLRGPLPYAEAVLVLQKALSSDAERAERALEAHTVCYPPSRPGLLLEPLLPDRIAEDLLARLLLGGARPGYDPAPLVSAWCADVLPRLLDPPGTARLVDAAQHHPHLTTQHVNGLLSAHPDLLVRAGGAALTTYTMLSGADSDVLRRLYGLMPPEHDPALGEAAASVLGRLHALTPELPTEQQVALEYEWGRRLLAVGDLDRAYTTAQRALETANGDARPHVLLLLSEIQEAFGQPENALAAARAALALAPGARTELRVAALHLPAGDPEGGLPHAEAAVRLAGDDPAALTVYAALLTETGAHEAAAEADARADALFGTRSGGLSIERERLVQLHNRAVRLDRSGRTPEALEVIRGALELCDRLPENTDDRLTTRHAGLLALRSGMTWSDAPEQSEHDATRALALLSHRSSPTTRPVRAWATLNRAMSLSALARHEEALRVTEDALALLGASGADSWPVTARLGAPVAHALATFAGVRLAAGAELDRARAAIAAALEGYAALSPTETVRRTEEIADAHRTRSGLAC
ncbi:TPR repeat-containing protein [Streptomyces sp. ACT-1]|nr:TPR repeat-containing protein [Streptomyces sp. ACT-1]EGE46657.1 TPR repeat-containing protein [Streptomyces sp. ACT-1]